MNSPKKKISSIDIILVLISLSFLSGMFFLFGPCGPKEDGSFMTCHWAGNALTGLAAVLATISFIHLIVSRSEIKTGLSLSVIPVSVLACLIPGKIITMCMMQEMRCRAVMKPAAIVCSMLLIIVAAVDVIMRNKRGK